MFGRPGTSGKDSDEPFFFTRIAFASMLVRLAIFVITFLSCFHSSATASTNSCRPSLGWAPVRGCFLELDGTDAHLSKARGRASGPSPLTRTAQSHSRTRSALTSFAIGPLSGFVHPAGIDASTACVVPRRSQCSISARTRSECACIRLSSDLPDSMAPASLIHVAMRFDHSAAFPHRKSLLSQSATPPSNPYQPLFSWSWYSSGLVAF